MHPTLILSIVYRKIIPGHIDVHPTDNALVVNYTVQATILGDDGAKVGGDKKKMEKMYAVNFLTPTFTGYA